MTQLTTSNNAIYQDFKLYIEGEECPFQSASISYGVGIIPEMVVQLAPFQILRNLGERTRVHLYFVDPVDQQQRLLFDGEISGVGYTKDPSSQVLTYTCSHVSRYLDEILVSFFDLSAYAMSIPPLYVETSGSMLKVDYSSFEHNTLEKVLSSDTLTKDKITSFQEIFKKFFREIYKTESATIDYFRKKMDEWKLEQRLAVLPVAGNASTLDAVFSLKDFLEFQDLLSLLRNEIRRLDGLVSVFGALREMFGRIFYVPVIIPPSYLKNDEQILQTVLYKPQTLFVLPPSCNVIWPSMYNVFSYSRNFRSIPTRLFARIDPFKFFSTKEKSDTGSLEYAMIYEWSPEELRDQIERSTGKLKSIGKGRAKSNKTEKDDVTLLKAYLEAITGEEEQKGVRLTQPSYSGVFTEYIEWLATKIKHKNDKSARKIEGLLDYELTRQRFETSLTSINMVFNPYFVPGFPCLIMDRLESGMHVYGYVMSVTHTIAVGSTSTSAEIGYIRQYDEPIVNKFFVAEDAWANEGEIYNAIFGIPSIKDASFNTIEDEKKRGDATEIPKHLEVSMRSGEFCDYIHNAYVRSQRPIVSKDEYDRFVKDLKYDADVQEKVRKYRSWIANRVAVHDYEEREE